MSGGSIIPKSLISSQGSSAEATAPSHALGVMRTVFQNPDGTSAVVPTAPTDTPAIGCGTDCGNVGGAYGGATFTSAGQTGIRRATCPGTLMPGTSYYLTGDVGSSPTQVGCVNLKRGDALDLRGYKVTGQILALGDTSGITVFDGSVDCNIPDTPSTVGGCIKISGDRPLSARTRLHHLTVNNAANSGKNSVRTVEVDSPLTTRPGMGYQLDHLTITVETAPISSRAIAINAIVGDPTEINNNDLTCSINANACQGMQVIDGGSHSVPSLIHNNLLVMLSAPSLPESARAVAINGPDNGPLGPSGFQVYANECTANSNRCFRARQVTGAIFQNNLVHACADTALGCYHFADPSGRAPFVADSGIVVEDDTVEMTGGTAFFVRNGGGITIKNVILQGSSGRLARVDFLPSLSTPASATFCNITGAARLTTASSVSADAVVNVINAGRWNVTDIINGGRGNPTTEDGLMNVLSSCP